MSVRGVDDHRLQVRGRRHEAVVARGGQQSFERIRNPAETEDYGCGKGRVAGELGDGLLDDFAADEEEEGEDIAGIAPLGAGFFGGGCADGECAGEDT